jgi:hypothetical protein
LTTVKAKEFSYSLGGLGILDVATTPNAIQNIWPPRGFE